MKLTALKCLKKLMDNVVITPVPSFLTGSSAFLQVKRTTIKAWMSLNLKQDQPRTEDFAAIERLNKMT